MAKRPTPAEMKAIKEKFSGKKEPEKKPKLRPLKKGEVDSPLSKAQRSLEVARQKVKDITKPSFKGNVLKADKAARAKVKTIEARVKTLKEKRTASLKRNDKAKTRMHKPSDRGSRAAAASKKRAAKEAAAKKKKK